MPTIRVEDVSKDFSAGGSGGLALSKASFSVEGGEFICLVGPSGSGKTTLLRIVGGLLAATEGTVRIGGLTPEQARQEGMFSWVFQTPVLLPWRSVIENVKLPLEIRKGGESRDPRKLLELVGLKGFEDYRPGALSGGMQQRAALARALTFDPKVLLMDEPFAAVDEFTRGTLNVELLRLFDELEMTILFVTHSIAEAVFLADRVIVLSSRPGRVKAVVEVPLARPRAAEIRATKEFQEIVQCVESSLH